MTIDLDHLIVPATDRVASARLLASLLGVPWAESGVGPFSPVYVNDGLTIDFDQAESTYPILHYCFRVSDEEFVSLIVRLPACNAGLGKKLREAPSAREFRWLGFFKTITCGFSLLWKFKN